MHALVPGVKGLKAVERQKLRVNAMVRGVFGSPLTAVQAEVPGRQTDLVIGVGLLFRRVLEIRVVAQWTEVLATIVVVILDDLWPLLSDVARFSASFLS